MESLNLEMCLELNVAWREAIRRRFEGVCHEYQYSSGNDIIYYSVLSLQEYQICVIPLSVFDKQDTYVNSSYIKPFPGFQLFLRSPMLWYIVDQPCQYI